MKYDSVNPFSKLHADEPWFFIRAQDKLSVDAVVAYAHLLRDEADKHAADEDLGLCKSLQVQSMNVLNFASTFMDWQEANPDKVKLPD